MAANCATSTGFAAFRTTATRVTRGAISLSSSSHFAPKANSTFMKPVVLPPGRARLATKALPTGSVTFANTIGTERFDCCNDATGGGPAAKITSGASAAIGGPREGCDGPFDLGRVVHIDRAQLHTE